MTGIPERLTPPIVIPRHLRTGMRSPPSEQQLPIHANRVQDRAVAFWDPCSLVADVGTGGLGSAILCRGPDTGGVPPEGRLLAGGPPSSSWRAV
jgi:hypothetical protein